MREPCTKAFVSFLFPQHYDMIQACNARIIRCTGNYRRAVSMDKALKIPDDQYRQWIADLSKRYQRSQIKAATSVNSEMLGFYWSLGRDIVTMNAESEYGSSFFNKLSLDLKTIIPAAKCFSPTNLRYMKRFYELVSDVSEKLPQIGAESRASAEIIPALSSSDKLPQVGAELLSIIILHYNGRLSRKIYFEIMHYR